MKELFSKHIAMHLGQHPSYVYISVYWFLICCTLVLLLLPLSSDASNTLTYFDKLVHALIFLVLTAMAIRIWTSHHLLTVLLLIAFGGLTELMQGLTGWRTASWADFVADTVGVLLGWFTLKISLKKHTD